MSMITVGVRYCTAHAGVANEDDHRCDFSGMDLDADGEPTPCAFRELGYVDEAADNPHFVNLGEVAATQAEFISFPLGETLFIYRREVWVGRPGNPESRIVGDIRPDPGHEVAVIVVWRTEHDGEVAGGEAADA